MQDIEDLFLQQSKTEGSKPILSAGSVQSEIKPRQVVDIQDAKELILVMQRHQRHNGMTKECIHSALRLCRSRPSHYLSEFLMAEGIPRLLVVAHLHPHDPQMQTLVACFLSSLLAHSFSFPSPTRLTSSSPASQPQTLPPAAAACSTSNEEGLSQAIPPDITTKEQTLLLQNIVKTQLQLFPAHQQHAGFCAYAALVMTWALKFLFGRESPLGKPGEIEAEAELTNAVYTFAVAIVKLHTSDSFCISNALQLIAQITSIEGASRISDEQIVEVQNILVEIFDSMSEHSDLDVVEEIFMLLQRRQENKREVTAYFDVGDVSAPNFGVSNKKSNERPNHKTTECCSQTTLDKSRHLMRWQQ